MVTKYVSEIDFISSAKQGEVIEIGLELLSVGTTSITFACLVRNIFSKKEILSIDKIVFVQVDEAEKAMPHGKTFEGICATSK